MTETFNALAPEALAGLLASASVVETATSPRAGGWTPPAPADLADLIPQVAVEELLGVGGMGAVYRARQVHLDRPVALKLLAPELAADPTFAARFRREARVLARLDHPHIVRLHDAGGSGERLWLLLELVEGASLRTALASGRFTQAGALQVLLPLCRALAYAHRAGVIHRDLKPDNILLDGEGAVKIVDFGLAKHALQLPTSAVLTATGERLGTASYMAPEQITGDAEVDHRADLYALGVVLYELLTGHLPLGRFEPPSRQAGIDPRLDAIVLRALERDPARRWPDAEALGQALAAIGAPPTPAVAPASAPLPPLLAGLHALRPWLPAIAAAGGGIAITVVASGTITWSGQLAILLLCLFLLTPLLGEPVTEAPPRPPLRELRRVTEGARLAGICTGLARCTPYPAWAWRCAFLAGCLLYGLGFLAYAGLWLAVEDIDRSGER